MIHMVSDASGKGKRLSSVIVEGMMKKIDGNLSGNFCSTIKENNIQKEVLFAVSSGIFSENEIIDMRHFNKRSNSEKTKYCTFFDAMGKMLEFHGLNTNERRHPQGRVSIGGGLMYMPLATSIPDLKKQTLNFIENNQKIVLSSQEVPSNTWIGLQFSPNNVHKKIAENYTGILNIKRHAQRRNCRDFHPHAHYVMKLKKSWREDLINIRHCLEHSCEIQLPWNQYLVAVSQDDKTSVPVSRTTPVASLVRNSTKVITPNDITISVCDHDFTSEKFIPSVNCWMNIGKDIGKITISLFVRLINTFYFLYMFYVKLILSFYKLISIFQCAKFR